MTNEKLYEVLGDINEKYVRAAKEYPDACEATRKDIDRKLSAALKEWREE